MRVSGTCLLPMTGHKYWIIACIGIVILGVLFFLFAGKTGIVGKAGEQNLPPQACIINQGILGLTQMFVPVVRDAEDCPTPSETQPCPYTYSWDFGDESEVVVDSQPVKHTYPGEKNYMVTLKVQDSQGAVTTISKEILTEDLISEISFDKTVFQTDTCVQRLMGVLTSCTIDADCVITGETGEVCHVAFLQCGKRLGAIDGDNMVTSADVLALVQGVVRTRSIDPKAADVTCDQQVNVLDVIQLIRSISGGEVLPAICP